MHPLDEPRFTFTEAALAAGVKPKILRNWLDRGQIFLDAEEQREGEGWRKFSTLDAIRIATISRLVDRCIPVKQASSVFESAIFRGRMSHLLMFNKIPFGAVAVSFANLVLLVWESGDSYSHTVCLGNFIDECISENKLLERESIMIFPLEAIIRDVLERLDLA